MHWAIEAALNVRKAANMTSEEFIKNINRIEIKAPKSNYIDRSVPENEHEARHPFQFNTCTALQDGLVTIDSYRDYQQTRPQLLSLLRKTCISSSDEIFPSFETMYVKVSVGLNNGKIITHRCITPNGHWRKPLSDADVEEKFNRNTGTLVKWKRQKIADLVWNMDISFPATLLLECL